MADRREVRLDGAARSVFSADVARLESMYRAAGKMVTAEVLAVPIDGYSPDLAARAMARVREIVADLDRASRKWLETSVAKHYSRAAAKARASLEILGRRPRKQACYSHVRRLIDDTAAVLSRANASIVDTAARVLSLTAQAARHVEAQKTLVQEFSFADVADKIAVMAARGVADWESAYKMTKSVRQYLVDLIGDGEFVSINGRNYNMRKYAELVAHTTLAEAQTAATLDLCNQFENDLVQWSDHQTDCEECEKYEGKIYSISGRHPVYPLLEAEPPVHPRCEHSLLPTSDIAIEVSRKYGHYLTPGELIGG